MMRRLTKTIAPFLTSGLLAIAAFEMAIGAPATPLDVPTPPGQATPLEQKSIAVGDASVSTQTGALQYGYPITLPPGRGGTPSVSLSYSSQAPIYGGLAVGWSLNAGAMIEVDVSSGRAFSHRLDSGEVLLAEETKFRSSLAGLQQLVPTDEFSTNRTPMTYRAMFDTTYAQYRRQTASSEFAWEVRTTGQRLQFGHAAQIDGAVPVTRWPLTREIDDFGNEIRYYWHGGESLDLKAIEYTINEDAGLPAPHARVEFTYGTSTLGTPECAQLRTPVGASSNAASGELRSDGKRKLVEVRTMARHSSSAKLRTARVVKLRYLDGSQGAPFNSERCDQRHGPQRFLWQIQESAYAQGPSASQPGPAVTLPPVTFEYGEISRPLTKNTVVTLPAATANEPERSLVWGHRYPRPQRWPTVEATLLDIDADGFMDRLAVVDKETCTIEVQLGSASRFTPAWTFTMPQLPYMDYSTTPYWPLVEECSLAAQRTYVRNEINTGTTGPARIGSYYAYRFLNLVGNDQYPDLVAALHYQAGKLDLSDAGLTQLGLEVPVCGDAPPENHCPLVSPDCVASAVRCTHGTIHPKPCTVDPTAAQLCLDLAPRDACGVLFSAPGGASPQEGCEYGWEADPDQEDVCNKVCGVGETMGADGECVHECMDDPELCSCGPGGCSDTVTLTPEPSSGNASHGPERVPFYACGGYVWYVYRNLGDGRFASQPETVYSPLPLESSTGSSALGSGPTAMTSSDHAFIDLNGDGHLDAVAVDSRQFPGASSGNAPYWWYVFFGDGNGGFQGQANGEPYPWWVPPIMARPTSSLSGSGLRRGRTEPMRFTFQQQGLYDVNGDGLPDLLWRKMYGDDSHTQVFLNNGLGFIQPVVDGPLRLSEDGLHGMLPTNEIVIDATYGPRDPYIGRGHGHTAAGVIDRDSDGRLDFFYPKFFTDEEHGFEGLFPSLSFNAGARVLATEHPLWGAEQRMQEQVHFDEDRWWVSSRYVDLTGDGRGDAVRVPETGHRRLEVATDDFGAMRLLESIDDGRGGQLEVTYASHTDSSVVVQHPEFARASGNPLWVVASLRTSDKWSHVDATTTYQYVDPAVTSDWLGHSAFRGFDHVVTHGPTGNVVLDDYDYDVDPTGRKIGTTVYENATRYGDAVSSASALNASRPHSIARTFWTEHKLRGDVRTFHSSGGTSWLCSKKHSYADCTTDGLQKSTVNTWTELTDSTGQTSAYVLKRSAEHVGPVNVVNGQPAMASYVGHKDDRATITTYKLRSSADEYKILQTETVLVGLSPRRTIADTATIYDPTWRVPVKTLSWVQDGHWATTAAGFDMSTGLPTWTQKPEQYRDSTTRVPDDPDYDPCADPAGLRYPASCVQYDPAELYPAVTRNELGHAVETTFDYALGKPIEARGPNADQNSQTRYDGLGRVLSLRVTGNPKSPTSLTEISKATYHEGSASVRPSTRQRSRMLWDSNAWTDTRTRLDASGRVLEKVVRLSKDGLPDAVSNYEYDPQGRLVTMRTPAPQELDSGRVTYTYGYDSLGRRTQTRSPLGAGSNSSYDGPWTTVQEFSPGCSAESCDEPRAYKELLADAFGRTTLVRERLAPDLFADTFYEYDHGNSVTRIIDAEGHATELMHDGAGNRRSITRGEKRWEYEYDDNGNMVAEVAPHHLDAGPEAYTTTFVYDALDRIESRLAGAGALASADRSLLGTGLVEYFYDQCTPGVDSCGYFDSELDERKNLLGQLRRVETGFTTTHYAYDGSGNPALERRSFSLPAQAGSFHDQRVTRRHFTPQGVAHRVAHPDGAWTGSGSPEPATTVTQTTFDSRGLPSKLKQHSDLGTRQLLELRRNRAGSPWEQRGMGEWVAPRSPFATCSAQRSHGSCRALRGCRWDYRRRRCTGSIEQQPPATPGVQRSWRYDRAGRVIEDRLGEPQAAFSPPSPSLLLARIDYWTGGDTKRIETAFGPTVTYHYDDRHQVSEAYENGEDFVQTALTYTQAGRIETANVATASSSSSARERDVEYIYPDATGQHEQVQELANIGTGDTLASYSYDRRGSVTRRTVDGEGTYRLSYDGDDRLRRLEYPDGSSEVYYYDHAGSRQLAVKLSASSNATKLRFWFGNTELEYDAVGRHKTSKLHLGLGAHPALRITDGDTYEFLHHNGLGNLLAVTDKRGDILASFSYTAFGELSSQGGSSASFDRTFNGKQTDTTSGISYYGFRYYDPLSMSWLRADPKYRFAPDLAGNQPLRQALYAFSLGNPLRYVDPDGHDAISLVVLPGDGVTTMQPGGNGVVLNAAHSAYISAFAGALAPSGEEVALYGAMGSADLALPFGDVAAAGLFLYRTGRRLPRAAAAADKAYRFKNKALKAASRIPKTGGRWRGTRGNGLWFSTKQAVTRVTKGAGVPFKNGRPDFTSWAVARLDFAPGLLTGKRSDFALVHQMLVEKMGFKNKATARKWLRKKKLTPHHESGTVIQLVPSGLHNNVPHTGSAADLRDQSSR